jgi:hypothetical protein
MNLENNIVNHLANQVPATSLQSFSEKKLDPVFISQCIEGSLPADYKKYYDLGYNFFKICNNDSISFLKNFFALFNDFFKEIIRSSNIDVEKQEAIVESLNLALKNSENNFQIIENLLNSFKVQKNLFDSNKLFMIITGYAINNLKKNYKR